MYVVNGMCCHKIVPTCNSAKRAIRKSIGKGFQEFSCIKCVDFGLLEITARYDEGWIRGQETYQVKRLYLWEIKGKICSWLGKEW